MGIKEILMERDRLSEKEAESLIAMAVDDLHERLAEGETPDDICEIWFGLEPDFIMELL